MSPGKTLRRPAAALGAIVCLLAPALVQPGMAQVGPGTAPGAQPQPQNSAPPPGGARAGEGAAPQQPQLQPLPPGCPFRDNKLELLVT